MKLLARLFLLRPAVVIGALPNTLANGQTVDATPLMANFNWIVNQVNSAGLAVTSLTPQLASANTFTALQSGINATQLANFPTATQIVNSTLTDCGTAGGSANALTLTTSIAIGAYAAGQEFGFLALADNTGATTVNIDALGAKSLVNTDGSALIAAQLKAGGAFRIRYDGANLQLLNPNIRATNGPILLATLTPTVAATVDALTTFTSSYDNYQILGSGITVGTSDTLLMRLANAGVVDTGSSYSAVLIDGNNITTTTTSISPSNQTVFGGGKGTSFDIRVLNANDATNLKVVQCYVVEQNVTTPGWRFDARACAYFAANAVSGVRFYWSGGNNFAATGKIRIYGFNNS